MGIRGLQSYIHFNSTSYLKKHELSDCCVVIDGSNLACRIVYNLEVNDQLSANYDVYLKEVNTVLLALKKCNLNAIFLFDGGSDSIKLRTKLSRREKKIGYLKAFCEEKIPQNDTIWPLLAVEVFVDVARTMGFTCIQCHLEADKEVTAVASTLKCPVISEDSDYFLCDVLYIPLLDVNFTCKKRSESDKYYMECLLFDVNEFLKINKLDKSLLPVLATLLDTHLGETVSLKKFFSFLHIPWDKNFSKKIKGLIKFLRKHNVNRALECILKFFTSEDHKKFSEVLEKNSNNFSSFTVSEPVYNEITRKFGHNQLSKDNLNFTWPNEIAKLFAETWIPGFLINIILHQIYFSPIQVENIYDTSSHLMCLKLIKKIYAMLTPYLTDKKPLSLYLVQNGEYKCIQVEPDPSDVISLDTILKEPQEVRLKLLCDFVGVSLEELKIVPLNSWAVFIMSFVYWAKEFKTSISIAHVDAFVMMVIANQVVQSKVGYYSDATEFMKAYEDKIAKLKGKELTLTNSSINFEDMLQNVTEYECILAQKELIPLRQRQNKNFPCVSIIHSFNCFQTCLFYVIIINGLLNYPLPYLKVQDFYTGSLLFNLYEFVKSDGKKFGSNLFLPMPNLNQIYKYLTEKLFKYIDG